MPAAWVPVHLFLNVMHRGGGVSRRCWHATVAWLRRHTHGDGEYLLTTAVGGPCNSMVHLCAVVRWRVPDTKQTRVQLARLLKVHLGVDMKVNLKRVSDGFGSIARAISYICRGYAEPWFEFSSNRPQHVASIVATADIAASEGPAQGEDKAKDRQATEALDEWKSEMGPVGHAFKPAYWADGDHYKSHELDEGAGDVCDGRLDDISDDGGA